VSPVEVGGLAIIGAYLLRVIYIYWRK